MTADTQLILTPSASRSLRRSLLWVGIFVILLVIALVGLLTLRGVGAQDPMSATNAAPAGAKALVEVLRHEGVTVQVTDSLEATQDAINGRAQTTLFFYDPYDFLSSAQETTLLGLASTVIVLDPSYDVLGLISTDLAQAGYVDGTLDANCPVDAAEAAEDITGDGSGFRVIGDDVDAIACFGSGDDVYSLVQVRTSSTTYTVLGATEALTNGRIAEAGNAALGLNLLGENATLVWYIPTDADVTGAAPTRGELSPAWVIPVSLTAMLVGLAAIFWRGRRLGPLIVENLPVTVRASETMQGRARLYEQANARSHTLDALRIGTIARIAKTCGLPVLATVDQVVLAAAAAAGRDPQEVRTLLVDLQPESDSALVHVSDELLRLETLVSLNSRPH